jgi:orotidine-5'-phosphate decarboxylase
MKAKEQLMKAKDRMFVALDVESPARAVELVQVLIPYTQMFKIGSKLFTAGGPDLVRKIVDLGAKVFLDLKFHDIPDIVAAASAEATRLGAFLFTIHASGGRKMMSQSVAAAEAAANHGQRRPLIVGVTVLTSADTNLLRETGISHSLEDQVANLSRLCASSGLDGVVASAHEVPLIRATVEKSDFVVVTPGIRLQSTSLDDQRRVMTPADAIRAGSDYLVVGRAITHSADPVRATSQILEEIEGSLA